MDERLGDTVRLLGTLLFFSGATLIVAWWAAHRALAPVRELEAGLQRLARGDAGAALPAFALREFSRVAGAIDALAAALAQARDAQRQLSRQLIQSADIAFATPIGLKNQRKCVVLHRLGLAIYLGQLCTKRSDGGGERRVLPRKARWALVTFRLVEITDGKTGNFAPEAHFAMGMPYDWGGRVTITRRG